MQIQGPDKDGQPEAASSPEKKVLSASRDEKGKQHQQQQEADGTPSGDNKKMEEFVVPSIYLQRTDTRYTSNNTDFGLRSTSRTIEDYKHEVHQLRRINIKLKSDLVELSERLDTEIAKRLANQNKVMNLAEKELANTHKTNENLKREVRLLRKKVDSGSAEKVEQLLAELRIKCEEVNELQSEIKSLKKVSSFQERGLVEAANDGLLTYMRENQQLRNEVRKLQQRCEASEREARRNKIPQRPAQIRTEDERVPVLQKQVEMFKTIDGKNKKDILVLTFEKNKVADELKAAKGEIEQKNKEIAALNLKIIELRKCLRPKGLKAPVQETVGVQEATEVHENPVDRLKRHRVKTLDDEPASQPNPRGQSKSSKFVDTSMMHSRSTRRSHFQSKKSMPPGMKIVSTKLYRPSYPKMDERGTKDPKSIPFNDHMLSSRMVSVGCYLNDQNEIGWLQAGYEKGSSPQTVQPTADYKLTNFVCETGEFIQYVSGGFSNDFLDYAMFVTNQKRTVKFGVEMPTSVKFDLNISEKEYPSALFGEVSQVVKGYRVNRIGCFIEAQEDRENDDLVSHAYSRGLVAAESNTALLQDIGDRRSEQQKDMITIKTQNQNSEPVALQASNKSEEKGQEASPATDVKQETAPPKPEEPLPSEPLQIEPIQIQPQVQAPQPPTEQKPSEQKQPEPPAAE